MKIKTCILVFMLIAVLLSCMTFASAQTYTDTARVKFVQQALNAAGFNAGTPDGDAGNKTKAAIRAYREANGLPSSADIDDELLSALGWAVTDLYAYLGADDETINTAPGSWQDYGTRVYDEEDYYIYKLYLTRAADHALYCNQVITFSGDYSVHGFLVGMSVNDLAQLANQMGAELTCVNKSGSEYQVFEIDDSSLNGTVSYYFLIQDHIAIACLAKYIPDTQEPAAAADSEPADKQETERIDLNGTIGADEAAIIAFANTSNGFWDDCGAWVVLDSDHREACRLMLSRDEDGKGFCSVFWVDSSQYAVGDCRVGMSTNDIVTCAQAQGAIVYSENNDTTQYYTVWNQTLHCDVEYYFTASDDIVTRIMVSLVVE